jgi:hypothetical protein
VMTAAGVLDERATASLRAERHAARIAAEG